MVTIIQLTSLVSKRQYSETWHEATPALQASLVK